MRGAIIGWDVGGAHLKGARISAAGRVERVAQAPCPLWQGMAHLERAWRALLPALGADARHAVTMTGEMTDLFGDRAQGVAAIVEAVEREAGAMPLSIFAGTRGFVPPAHAARASEEVASANWLGPALWLARRLGDAMLVDIGSTTTDLVPIRDGQLLSRGQGDAGRLAQEELVYTGVVRTPVMAMAPRVPFDGAWIAPMAEYFATSADVHRLCGDLPDEADQQPAADGGEKTIDGSARRLARMVGRDYPACGLAPLQALARWLAERQLRTLHDAGARILSRSHGSASMVLVGAGCGRFLAAQLATRLDMPYRDFAATLPLGGADPDWAANCAPAVAVGLLAHSW